MKLNLVGIGSFASQLVDKFKDEDCDSILFRENLANFDLETNEIEYQRLHSEDVYDLSNIQETFCFVDGREGIAGITLALLSKLSDKHITVFLMIYNCQSDIEKANQKITFNVLQEYARSGVFKGIFLLHYDKLFDSVVNNIPDTAEISISDVNNKLIDKVLFGVYVYWRLNTEKYAEGDQIRFTDTIYRIKTFFEPTESADYMYGDISYIGNKLLVKGLKERMQKRELLELQEFKKGVQKRGDRYVLLSSEFDFVLGIAESKIVQ